MFSRRRVPGIPAGITAHAQPTIPELTPSSFADCVKWHDARELSAGAVNVWPDRSTLAQDYIGTGHAPTASATSFNSKPGVGSFDATHYLLKSGFTGLNGKTAFTLFLLAHFGTNDTTRCPFNIGINPGVQILANYLAGGDLVAAIDNGGGYAQETAFSDGDYLITLTGDRAATPECNLYINDVLHNDDNVDGATGAFATADSRLGAYTNSLLYPFDGGGVIGFVAMYSRVVTSQERATMKAFLFEKWGL